MLRAHEYGLPYCLDQELDGQVMRGELAGWPRGPNGSFATFCSSSFILVDNLYFPHFLNYNTKSPVTDSFPSWGFGVLGFWGFRVRVW